MYQKKKSLNRQQFKKGLIKKKSLIEKTNWLKEKSFLQEDELD